jgi:hypothetical protein
LTAPRRWMCAFAALGPSLFLATSASAFCRSRTCSDAPDEGFECRRDSRGCISQGLLLSYETPCLSFAVASGAGKALDLSDNEVVEIVERAFNRWRSADCGQGTHPGMFVQGVGLVESSHIYFCEEPSLNTSVWLLQPRWTLNQNALGNTASVFTSSGEVVDADVQLNLNAILEHAEASSTKEVLLAIATHEAGHALGLAHSDDENAIMAAHYADEELTGRELTADDADGICELFPPEQAPTRCPKAGVSDAALNDEHCTLAILEATYGDDPSAKKNAEATSCSVLPRTGAAAYPSLQPWLCFLAFAAFVLRRGRRTNPLVESFVLAKLINAVSRR